MQPGLPPAPWAVPANFLAKIETRYSRSNTGKARLCTFKGRTLQALGVPVSAAAAGGAPQAHPGGAAGAGCAGCGHGSGARWACLAECRHGIGVRWAWSLCTELASHTTAPLLVPRCLTNAFNAPSLTSLLPLMPVQASALPRAAGVWRPPWLGLLPRRRGCSAATACRLSPGAWWALWLPPKWRPRSGHGRVGAALLPCNSPVLCHKVIGCFCAGRAQPVALLWPPAASTRHRQPAASEAGMAPCAGTQVQLQLLDAAGATRQVDIVSRRLAQPPIRQVASTVVQHVPGGRCHQACCNKARPTALAA